MLRKARDYFFRKIIPWIGAIIFLFGVALGSFGFLTVEGSHAQSYLFSLSSGFLVAGMVIVFLDRSQAEREAVFLEATNAHHEVLKEIHSGCEDLLLSAIPSVLENHDSFHSYHMTRRDGINVWMYNPLTLLVDQSRFKIEGQRVALNLKGEENFFSVSAGMRGRKLVVVYTKENNPGVDSVIDVIHNFSNPNREFYVGFRLHETWDSDNSISPVLISRGEMFRHRRKPKVANAEEHALLAKAFQDAAKRDQIIPLIPSI